MIEPDADEDDVDLILIEDDSPAEARMQRRDDAHPWRILIVDDDVDVHVVTKFALNNTEFQGRRLSYLHAYSAAEALATMRAVPDIALVLLDVIMDSPDAGLRVVQQIRTDLHNDLVRIVLRTGQAGQAGLYQAQEQERALLLEYDINDFWSKADLTTRKLVSTVISSLRTYSALAAASVARRTLAARNDQLEQVRAAIEPHLPLLVLDRHGMVLEVSEALCRLAGLPAGALVGRLAPTLAASLGLPHELLADGSTALAAINARLAEDGVWSGTLPLRRGDAAPVPTCWTVQAMRGPDGHVSGYVVLGPPSAPFA